MRLLPIFLLLFFSKKIQAQADTTAQAAAPQTILKIEEITIAGNKKTRNAVIFREMNLHVGDTILLENLAPRLDRNRLLLMNTELFTSVKINVRRWSADNRISLHVEVEESWFIFPIPIFQLADRNFNVWWRDFDHSFERVFWGLDLYHFNFSGNNDYLKIGAQFGYAQRFEAAYNHPGLNRRRTLGFRGEFFYSRLREIPLTTLENELIFRFEPAQNLGRQWRAVASLNWRPGLFTTHTFTLERRENQIAAHVARDLNPDYFLNGRTRQQHFSLIYIFQRDRRDIRPYPLRGWFFRAEFRKNGLLPSDDLQLARLNLRYDRYFSFSKKLSLEVISGAKLTLPRRKIPYFNNQALGYRNDLVRGYEYYVVDGSDFGLLKTGLHLELFNRSMQLGKLMPLKTFRVFPLKIYLTLNNDFGYSNDPSYSAGNPLTNQFLYGYGIGVDIVAYYTRVGQFEISRNRLGETGFFFKVRDEF